jgi:hypothetical protein
MATSDFRHGVLAVCDLLGDLQRRHGDVLSVPTIKLEIRERLFREVVRPRRDEFRS